MPSRPARLPGRALLLTALLSVSCKKCNPEEPPDIVDDQDDIPPVESTLQVVSIDPSRHRAEVEFPARVYGGGFADGLRVIVGDRTLDRVKVADENTLSVVVPPLPSGTYDVRVESASGEHSTLRGGLTLGGLSIAECREVTVHFAFDQAGLTTEAQQVLDDKVACWQAGSGELRVEGHADTRGTTDYNVALGQRRADTVRRHLTSRGVSGNRIHTVSYGEERPVDPGHSEAAWAKNRRVEIHASE